MRPKLYSRSDAAKYLEEIGISSSKVTLARYAMVGSGPKYALINGRAYYEEAWLDEWVNQQMMPIEHPAQYLLNREVR